MTKQVAGSCGAMMIAAMIFGAVAPAGADWPEALAAAEYGDIYVHRVDEPGEPVVSILPGYFTHTGIKSTDVSGAWLDARGWEHDSVTGCPWGLYGGILKTADPAKQYEPDPDWEAGDPGPTGMSTDEYDGMETKAIFHVTNKGPFVKFDAANFAYDWFYTRYSFGFEQGATPVPSWLGGTCTQVPSPSTSVSSYDWGWADTSADEHPACSTMIYWSYASDQKVDSCGKTYYGGGISSIPLRDYTRQIANGCNVLIDLYDDTFGEDLCELNHLAVIGHMLGWIQGDEGEGDGYMGDDQVVLDFCDALNAPSAPDCTNSTYCYQNVSATDLVEYHVDEGYTQGYFVYSTSNWSDYTMGIEYDTDRPGGDSTWSYQDDPDPDTCATACTSDTSCWAYTFTPPGHFGAGSKARCYHKSRIPDAVDMPSSGLVSGVRQAPVFMGYRRTGTVILSTVYKTYYANEFSWQASSNGLENCRDACSGDAACIAYDFDTKGGTCELFSHLDPLGWIPDDDWAYGMLSNRLSVTAPTNGQTLEYGIPVTLSVSAEYTAIPSGCGVYWKSDVDGNMGGALSLFGSTSWTKSYTFLSPGTRYITSYISCDGGASSYINPESDIAHPHYNPSNRTLNITAHNSQPNTPVITSPAHNSQVAQTFVATNSATDPNETLSCSQRSTKLCRKLLQLLGGYTTSCSSAVTGCSPTLTTANLGWHWLEVTATDDYGLSTKNTVALLPAPTDVYITTGSAPVVSISQPAADATLNVGTSYTLTGSVSGRSIISTYKWYYTLGPEASYSQVYIGAGSSLSWTPTSSIFTGTGNGGFYLFLRFYATDSLGKTGVQVRRVWISDPNNVPS